MLQFPLVKEGTLLYTMDNNLKNFVEPNRVQGITLTITKKVNHLANFPSIKVNHL